MDPVRSRDRTKSSMSTLIRNNSKKVNHNFTDRT